MMVARFTLFILDSGGDRKSLQVNHCGLGGNLSRQILHFEYEWIGVLDQRAHRVRYCGAI